MDNSKIATKYAKALELKGSEKYSDTLKVELSKPEWKQRLSEILAEMESIDSIKGYEKAMTKLKQMFNDVYEKITAPGLDAFIEWVNDHTKNQENVRKLRAFLMKDYETYSSSIDAILSAVENLPDEEDSLLFDKIISDFNKKLKSEVSKFLNEPDKFANAIDGFLSKMKSEYEGLAGIHELAYKSIEQLYTEDQKADETISFYMNVIKLAINGGQDLAPLNEEEQAMSLYKRAKNRVNSIKSCITSLKASGIAQSSDEELKYLFSRYEKEMVNTKGDVSTYLTEYLEKIWSPLHEKYTAIKRFYEEDELTFKEDDWKGFSLENDINALLKSYKLVRSSNVLPSLRALKLEEVSSKITKCHKSISDLQTKENDTGRNVREYFEDFIQTYEGKRSMVEKLVEIHPELNSDFENIYSETSKCKYLPNIKNGIESINQDGTFLVAMSESESTVYEMNKDMKETKEVFLNILKKSQMEKQIEWINGLTTNELSEDTFKPEYLLELIKQGLITLSFEKNF
jgi:DNA-directed RNA polymerase subunit F